MVVQGVQELMDKLGRELTAVMGDLSLVLFTASADEAASFMIPLRTTAATTPEMVGLVVVTPSIITGEGLAARA